MYETWRRYNKKAIHTALWWLPILVYLSLKLSNQQSSQLLFPQQASLANCRWVSMECSSGFIGTKIYWSNPTQHPIPNPAPLQKHTYTLQSYHFKPQKKLQTIPRQPKNQMLLSIQNFWTFTLKITLHYT